MRLEMLVAALALASPPAPPMPVNSWILEDQVGCDWWISGPDGKQLHASIGIGSGGDPPVLTVSDPVFLRFGEELRPRIVLRANGQASRSVTLESWSSHVGTETAMLGMFLTPRARRVLGGATRIQILSGGKVLIDMPMTATPGKAALDACVQPPNPNGD